MTSEGSRNQTRRTVRTRGAADNPPNRFEKSWHELDPEADDPDLSDPDSQPSPKTEFLDDATRSIIAKNNSPDIPFDASINPYRGCEHGCAYCYARPSHEYLGLSAGLDFETKILVKHDAPALLRKELSSRKWVPTPLSISGVTDPYQPIERKLTITRKCLEVLAEFRNPVGIVTKNRLVIRDIDVLLELARHEAAVVFLSVTTLDAGLSRRLEPRASLPSQRLDAVAQLNEAGIPVGVMVAPVIPGLTDHEIPAILEAAKSAGAKSAAYVPLRLPLAVAPLFSDWLDRHEPGRKEKILGRIRGMRDGKLNDAKFGSRMNGSGAFAEIIGTVFHGTCNRLGINQESRRLSSSAFRRAGADEERQLRLFE